MGHCQILKFRFSPGQDKARNQDAVVNVQEIISALKDDLASHARVWQQGSSAIAPMQARPPKAQTQAAHDLRLHHGAKCRLLRSRR